MNKQDERLDFLLTQLLHEDLQYRHIEIPENTSGKKQLLRGLLNVRLPRPISQRFIDIENEYLQVELSHKIITRIDDLTERQSDFYLWQGDITTLKVDAIVNAANSQMLGCFIPGHNCIDNIIHTNAGIQLRLECADIMNKQGHEEPVGQAKITSAYNLPCRCVIHTVGPMVESTLTKRHEDLLESSYRSCLDIAQRNGLKSIAFCCISTGVFRFPNDKAAKIAINTVKKWKHETGSDIKIVFNVFKDIDLDIYDTLLS